MARQWTEEQREAQRVRCRQNRPWDCSTGPTTTNGKARSSRNAFKGGPLVLAEQASRVGDYKKFLRDIARHHREQRPDLSIFS
jgi:hypothetical protein